MDPWLDTFKSFLDTILRRIIKSPQDRQKYLTPDALVIWTRAFTHETVSPSDNYEDLEFLGDALLKAVFPKYLMKRLPHLHKGEYTELNVFYMSKMTQSDLSRKLGFNRYIRVKGLDRSILNLDTDVFEAFFGALDEVSDLVSPGLGFINCYNMIVDIFKDVYIDESKGFGSAKTQVIQMFVRFDLPKPEEQTSGSEVSIVAGSQMAKFLGTQDRLLGRAVAAKDKDAEFEAYKQVISNLSEKGLIEIYDHKISKQGTQELSSFSVRLRPEHLEFLAKYGVKIKNPVIGHAEAPTKKQAESDAYAAALRTLEEHLVTTEWAEEAKQVLDFSGEDIERFVGPANRRLRLEGYESMYFFLPRKTVTPKGAVVELVGVTPEDKHEVLGVVYATDRENGYRSSKVRLVQEYALGG